MSFDSYDDPRSQALLTLGQQRLSRDGGLRRGDLTEVAAAIGLLLAGTALAVAGSGSRPLSPLALVALGAVFLVARRIKFPVGSVSTWPAQLVIIPMLVLLPVALVPLVTVAYELLDLLSRPDEWRASRAARARRVVARIADCWFTVGSAGLLLVTGIGAGHFSWSQIGLYAAAVVAQSGVDLGAGLTRTFLAREQMPAFGQHMLWIYMVDLGLACVALPIAAAAAAGGSAVILLELPALALLGAFARERRQRLTTSQTLQRAYRGTVGLLGEVIESEDEYTGVHSQAVVELSLAAARRLCLGPEACQRVEFGALLHDVGKIRIPKAILHKPGKLDDREWGIMRSHTAIGEEMLQGLGGALASIGRIVRHTHERWDGGGYPDGLSGAAIPIESRIIAAADAFNAMTTDRPYRAGMPIDEAIVELRRCAGSQFDPAVVDALIADLAAQARVTELSEPLAAAG